MLKFLIILVLLSTPSYVDEHIYIVPVTEAKTIEQVHKPTEPPVLKEYTVEDLKEVSDHYATKWGVSTSTTRGVVTGESKWKLNWVGDENYICPLTGLIAPSYGPVQINSCWHPEVTREQAEDPHFAFNFLAQGIAEGRGDEWTAYRNLSI